MLINKFLNHPTKLMTIIKSSRLNKKISSTSRGPASELKKSVVGAFDDAYLMFSDLKATSGGVSIKSYSL